MSANFNRRVRAHLESQGLIVTQASKNACFNFAAFKGIDTTQAIHAILGNIVSMSDLDAETCDKILEEYNTNCRSPSRKDQKAPEIKLVSCRIKNNWTTSEKAELRNLEKSTGARVYLASRDDSTPHFLIQIVPLEAC